MKFVEFSRWTKIQEVNDFLVRGTQAVAEIYERCNFVALEPKEYDEANKMNGWRCVI